MNKSPIAECVRALKSDRLVTLNIGQAEALFSVQVQQAVLEAASPWFQKALGDDRFVEGQSGVISFPEDDTESWQILLYWLLHHDLRLLTGPPEKDCFIAFAKCWVLGDKYDLSRFQDEVMLYLLQFAFWTREDFQPGEYKELIKITPADSKLMRLLGEEVAVKYGDPDALTWDVTTVLDGVEGFWPAFLKAQQGLRSAKIGHFDDRLLGVDSNGLRKPHWQEYMVGALPSFEGMIADRRS